MKNFIFFVSFILIISALIKNEIIADCTLSLYCPNNWNSLTQVGCINPDSVKVDSCENSQTFGKLFAKKYFLIQLKPYYYPFDNVLKPDTVKQVSDISNNKQQLKQRFEELELEFGKIYFTGLFTEFSDSSLIANPLLLIYFDEIQDCNLIEETFSSTIDSVNFVKYRMCAMIPLSTPSDIALEQDNYLSDILLNWKFDRNYGNHSWYSDFFPRNWEPYGYQSNIYEVNCPLAWEITMGRQSIFLAIRDEWINPSNHPDVIQNQFVPSNIGDSFDFFLTLSTGHGLAVMSNAVARNDNGFPMVGTAPQCRAISVGSDAINFDLDGINNNPNYFLFPDVQNCSYIGGGMTSQVIDSGIVVIAGAGNDRAWLGGNSPRGLYVLQPDGTYEVRPTKVYPAASAYFDAADDDDGTKDYRVIAVAATKSGVLLNQNCEEWFANQGDGGPNFTKDLQFYDSYNFSPGLDKFNNSTSYSVRITAKENAFVDLIAPGNGILVASEGYGLSTCDASFTIGSIEWFICKTNISYNPPLTLNDIDNIMVQTSTTTTDPLNANSMTYGQE